MKTTSLSIVIPTHNRLEVLQRTLASLAGQAGDASISEVVIVDDGSSDGTGDWLRSNMGSLPINVVKHFLPVNGGPARARNTGIRSASGDVVLFLGDDTVPAPGLLGRHAKWHEQHPDEESALLGRVTWPPDAEVSSFMRWLESGGQAYYFNYAAVRKDEANSGRFFYTCNVSVKRTLLLKTGLFDESFRFASHEDLELGNRLGAAGMRLWFDPEALAWHWHPLDLPGMYRRVYRMGYSAPWYWRKAGDSASAWRRAFRRMLVGVCGTGPVRRFGEALSRNADGGPLRWHTALAIAFSGGMADHLRGCPPLGKDA